MPDSITAPRILPAPDALRAGGPPNVVRGLGVQERTFFDAAAARRYAARCVEARRRATARARQYTLDL
jgi:hypothetical protein